MKAARINQYGEPDVIQINEIDTPIPREDQICVEVRAAAINPFDWKVRRGYMKEMIPLQFPITIGADFSGTVSEVSPNVTDYKPGDEVYGSAIVLGGGSGAIAEYAAVNTKSIALKPKSSSHAEAAGLVLVGISTIQALENHIGLQNGQKILIHGGAGGIGSVAIQYAKHMGAFVATTVRGVDKEFVSQLGADETIDYETERFEEKLSDFDAVFDTVGADTLVRSFEVLKPGGVIVSMVEQPDAERAAKHQVRAEYQQSQTDTATLTQLAELADAGILKAHIDRSFPFDQTAEAFKHAEEDHPKGKVVIEMGSTV